MHTWLIEWVPVRPVRSDVTVIIVSAGDEGFGRVPCLDSRKRLGTVGEKCSHTPPSICQQLWPLLSGFVWKWYVWWRKGTSPTPLLSHSETPPHFVIAHWLYVPQQLCRCLRSSFVPSISFCLSLSSSSLVVSLDPSPFSPYTTTTTTSIVEFRQAIYIFLPGCFISHSLNKVFFIVFAFLGARESERTHVCL